MAADLDALARQWFEQVWNQKRFDVVHQMTTPQSIVHGLGTDDPAAGVEFFKAFHANFLNAFPDLNIVVEEVITQDDRAAIRFSFTGTHTGNGLGVPASGKRIAATGMSVTHWREGRIVEAWNEFDAAGMMKQIGAGPS